MAIEDFVRKYYPLIIRYCRLHLWDAEEAEDVTQEVFARFFRTLPQYQHYGKAANYLYVIAGNLCRDSHKKIHPLPLEELPEQAREMTPVLDMMNYSYSDGFQNFDWYCNEHVTPEQAGDFYSNRTKLMKAWLLDENGSAKHLFSENERQFLIDQYETLETPFYVDYTEGWTQLLYNSPFVIMVAALILGFLSSGIFAGEYRWKADPVFFGARHGRDRAVWAKIEAGFWMVTALYWASFLIYSLVTLGLLGFDGGNCPLQIDLWKSFYHLKLWQVWLLTAVGGYIGNLFFAFFTMWVSAKTRSAVFAGTVPFLLVFLPGFLDNLNSDKISKLLGLLPNQLLEIYQALRYFYVYDFGFTVKSAMEILPLLYAVLTAILVPMMYRQFRRRPIK